METPVETFGFRSQIVEMGFYTPCSPVARRIRQSGWDLGSPVVSGWHEPFHYPASKQDIFR